MKRVFADDAATRSDMIIHSQNQVAAQHATIVDTHQNTTISYN